MRLRKIIVTVQIAFTLILVIKPTDPLTIAAATLALCLMALVATMIPAHRASAVNPPRHFGSSS